MLVFDVAPNCLMIAENGCIRLLPCFFCTIESTGAGVIRHAGWNNRQQIGCSQAKLICFHLLWKLLQVQCLHVTLSLSLCDERYQCVTHELSVFYCAACLYVCLLFCVFSGGRNIVVTGSGFDLIQSAVMMVQGDNMKAYEVCVSSICPLSSSPSFTQPADYQSLKVIPLLSPLRSLFLTVSLLWFWEFPLFHLFSPHCNSGVHLSPHISWAHD